MSRKGTILKNVSHGVIYKVINMGIVFITIPVLLNYLDKELYGIWVTIFSVINIVFFVDIGIANGLKTKLTEAMSSGDIALARTHISNAYVLISFLAILLLMAGSISIYYLDLNDLLNIHMSQSELKKILFITLFMVVIGFILSLYKSFYYAVQQSFKVELSLLLYQLIVLIAVVAFSEYSDESLLSVALIYGLTSLFVSVIFTFKFFRKHENLKPSFGYFKISRIKDLMDLSLGFFTIQLSMIVIFATDNVLISNLLEPIEVAHYDIVLKLFQSSIVVAIIAQDPFWPLYTDAYQKKDFKWIRQTIIRLNKLFVLFIVLVAVLVFISKQIIRFWIPKELQISNTLIILMGVFVIVRVYGIIYMYFLNAVGKIKLQIQLFILGAIINIPLSIYFVKYMYLGTTGVILGTIISILALSIFLPFQTFRILNDCESKENFSRDKHYEAKETNE